MSHKRINLQRENDMSSGVLTVEGDISTLLSFNSEVGNDSININVPGTAVILDRTTNFKPEPQYVSWAQTLSIVSPSDNGSYIIYVDNTGLVKIDEVNQNAKLPAFDIGGLDMNNAVQLGT